MAIPSTSLHTRSISLPSTSHPIETSVEDQLRRLRVSQAGPSSSSSICQSLCGIKDLYEYMNDFISLPHNQKALSREDVEKVLEGTVALLDASSSAFDAVSQMKESILDLQSSLRRGNSDKGISAYLVSRKKINKIVSKCLKATGKNCASSENVDITIRMLKEAEAITLSTLKSLLSFVMGKKASSWSMVTKLVKSKRVSCESGKATEVEEMDHILLSLSDKRLSAKTNSLLEQLDTLEAVIHEVEDGMVLVSRCLVKTRVSLLNVLTY